MRFAQQEMIKASMTFQYTGTCTFSDIPNYVLTSYANYF